MRAANKWVVVGAAAAVAGFAGGVAAGDTTRDIKLNDPAAVDEVTGQLSADDPGHFDVSADDAGQQFRGDDSPGSPDSPDGTADSPDGTADSPESSSYGHAGSADSAASAGSTTTSSQQRADDGQYGGADSAQSPSDD